LRIIKEQSARIVIVEDSKAEVWLLQEALDQEGEAFVLEVLRDGEAAMQFVRDQRKGVSEPQPCIIVLDLHLPKYDGASVLRAIREESALSHVRVIVLTTRASADEEAEVRKLGVSLYRTKPKELRDYTVLAKEIIAICHETADTPA
jgi:DNA-binding response OmpR family regulator